MKTVIETDTGYVIQCKACGWHEYPKQGRPGASWTFNGDRERPSFSPSMNELVNGPGKDHRPDVPTRRCHFTVTDGQIEYHGDCTHELRGRHPLEPWSESQIAGYAERLT